MQTAKEKFAEIMKNVAFNEWYMSRPERIKELIQQYPYEKYIMKDDAPYGLTSPGQIVYLVAYQESGHVRVGVRAEEFTQPTLDHIKMLCKRHGKDFEEMKLTNCSAHIDPKYLEPIE